MVSSDRVIVVGAGPVGMVAALGLARQGIPVTVLEAEPDLPRDPRAGSFHPPTLEMLAPLGIADRMLAIGIQVPIWQMRDRQIGLVAEFDLGLLRNDTPYPYRLHLEQWKLSDIVAEMLRAEPHAELLLGTTFVSLTQDADQVEATAQHNGEIITLRGRYLIGADGGRSSVRKQIEVDFEGFTWPERFLVISTFHDLAQHGIAPNAYVADPDEWCAVFKMPHSGPPGLWRVAFPTDLELADDTVLSEEFCQRKLRNFLPGDRSYSLDYRGVYRVHQRVAKEFRVGRVLLAGDAAHVNNPLGALGLNGGIHDAINLVEKLGPVWRGEADATLLDRYVRQRRQTNIEHVQSLSIRNKRVLEERDPAVRATRIQELRDLAADPARSYQHLLNTSMISSVRRAATIE